MNFAGIISRFSNTRFSIGMFFFLLGIIVLILFPILSSLIATHIRTYTSAGVSELNEEYPKLYPAILVENPNGDVRNIMYKASIVGIIIALGEANVTPVIKHCINGSWDVNVSVTSLPGWKTEQSTFTSYSDRFVGPIIRFETEGVYLLNINITTIPNMSCSFLGFSMRIYGSSISSYLLLRTIGISVLLIGIGLFFFSRKLFIKEWSITGWSLGLTMAPILSLTIFILYLFLGVKPSSRILWVNTAHLAPGETIIDTGLHSLRNDLYYYLSRSYSPFNDDTFTLLWLLVAAAISLMAWSSISETRLGLFEDLFLSNRKAVFLRKTLIPLIIVIFPIILGEFIALIIMTPYLLTVYPDIVVALLLSSLIILILGTLFVQSMATILNLVIKKSLIVALILEIGIILAFTKMPLPIASAFSLIKVFNTMDLVYGPYLIGEPHNVAWRTIVTTNTTLVFLVVSIVFYLLSYIVYRRYEPS